MMREQIIACAQTMPSMPATVVKLANLLGNPETGVDEIVKVIRYDPGFTANILKIANSASLGFPHRVGSLKEAVIRIGTHRIFQITVASSIQPIMQQSVNGYMLEAGEFWKHSVAVAAAAEKFAASVKKVTGDAFTAGLLHDMGKLAMANFVNISSKDLFGAKESAVAFDALEKDLFGIDHAEVGASILEKWSFPAELVEAVRFHHRPDEQEGTGPLVDIVHAADALCLSAGLGTGRDGLQYRISDESSKRLGLDHGQIEGILCKTMENMKRFQDLLSVAVE